MLIYKGKRMDVFFLKQKKAYEVAGCDWSTDVCSSDLMRDDFEWEKYSPDRPDRKSVV